MLQLNWPASFAERLAYSALVMLTAVNIGMVLSFWGSLGGDKALLYQFMGGGLAVIEITALVVIAEANARGENEKARAWWVVFPLVLVLGLAGDFGALLERGARDGEGRSHAVARYDAALIDDREASAEILRLGAQLDALGARRPVAALKAERDDAVARRDRHVAAGLIVPRSVAVRAVTSESALATAEALAKAEMKREAARVVLRQAGRRPDAEHPQFAGMATLLGVTGFQVSAEAVRVLLAAYAALVLKIVLVVGFWVLTPKGGFWGKRESVPPQEVGEAAVNVLGPAAHVPPALDRPMVATARPPAEADAIAAALEDLENGRV